MEQKEGTMKIEKDEQFRLLGYCPRCKEALWYDWDEDFCSSDCVCNPQTRCKDLIAQRREEEE